VDSVLTDVNGIPLIWGEDAKPFRAAIMFRVGRSDETLRTAGLTHIVEHLAASTIDKRPHPYNAFVDANRTVFVAAGPEEEVVRFLADISVALSALPLGRLTTEKRILSMEAQSRERNFVTDLLFMRYGAAGFGLMHAPEFGLRWLSEQDVADWSAERFTADNAIVWMTGPPPAGMTIHLPAGRRWDPIEPAIERPGLEYPSYVVSSDQQMGTAISSVTPRTTVANIARSIFLQRLMDELRLRQGLAYGVGANYLGLNRHQGHFAFALDAVQESSARVRDEVLRVLYELAEKGPTEKELADHPELRRRSRDYPGFMTQHLDSEASFRLFGETDALSPDAWDLEAEQVTAGDAGASLRNMLETMLVRGPSGVAIPNEGFKPYELWSSDRIVGQAFDRITPVRQKQKRLQRKKVAEPRRDVLYVGKAGVSVITARGERTTVRYDHCEAVVEGADGVRFLWGRDGEWIGVRPSDWEQGAEAVARIDQTRPPGLVVPAPPEPGSSEAVAGGSGS
jgi:predicted Zn-dependent peptidase